jgi:hypothetical protein
LALPDVAILELKVFTAVVFGLAQTPQVPPLLQYLQLEQFEQALHGVLP